MQPGPLVPQAGGGRSRLVARVFFVDRFVLRRHGGGFFNDEPAPGGDDEKHLLSVVRRDLLVGAGPKHDVGNPERARQQLHVRQHVALALGEDAGGRVEVGRRIGERHDLVPGIRAVLRRDPQAAEGKPGVERAHAGVGRGAEEVMTSALPSGGVFVQAARHPRIEQHWRAAQDVVPDGGGWRQQHGPGRPHLREGEHGITLGPFDHSFGLPQLRREVSARLARRRHEITQGSAGGLALPLAEQAGAVSRVGEGAEKLQMPLSRQTGAALQQRVPAVLDEPGQRDVEVDQTPGIARGRLAPRHRLPRQHHERRQRRNGIDPIGVRRREPHRELGAQRLVFDLRNLALERALVERSQFIDLLGELVDLRTCRSRGEAVPIRRQLWNQAGGKLVVDRVPQRLELWIGGLNARGHGAHLLNLAEILAHEVAFLQLVGQQEMAVVLELGSAQIALEKAG